MSASFADRRAAFLKLFFASPNEFSFVNGDSSAVAAQHWEDALTDEHSVAVLPRRHKGKLYWYGIALGEPAARELREQLLAFAGPSYSDFAGQQVRLNAHDPIEGAVLEFAGPHAFRFRPGNAPEAEKELAKALNLMWQVRDGQERRPNAGPRATGRILRDFYLALLAGDRAAAEESLAYLQTHHALDPLNLTFLEVQLLAELGLWDELAAHHDFGTLVKVRRPRSVTRALIRAVYRAHLQRFEDDDDPDGARAHFRDVRLPLMPTLFTARVGITDPEVLKTFMLLAVCSDPPRPELARELLQVPDVPEADRAYLQRLAERLPATTPAPAPADLVEAARTAYDDADFDTALRLAAPAPAGFERARLLLQCANELQTNEAARLAVDSVSQLCQAEHDKLARFKSLWAIWEHLVQSQAEPPCDQPTIPADWTEWLERITDPHWQGANAAAEAGADEWPLGPLLAGVGCLDRLEQTLHTAMNDEVGAERLNTNLPHLLRFVQQDEAYPSPVLKGVYSALRTALVYGPRSGSDPEFAVFTDLCEAALKLGTSAGEYQGLLQDMQDLWYEFAAPSHLDHWLDVLGLLLYYPSKSEEARAAFATQVVGKAARWVPLGYVGDAQMRVLSRLAVGAGLADLLVGMHPPEEASGDEGALADPLAALSGKVAIYSLSEAAANRARQMLEEASPHCEVVLNHDKVGSEQLRSLAKAADLFVMVTGSAKHAATGCIEQHRKERPLLRVARKSAVAIIEEIISFVRGQWRQALSTA